jgi:hypothetical protein
MCERSEREEKRKGSGALFFIDPDATADGKVQNRMSSCRRLPVFLPNN